MALGPRLDLRQSQSLVMTPQLQQAIRLLALSNLEIESFIAEELDRNPLLESAGGEGDTAGEAPDAAVALRDTPAMESDGADVLIASGDAAADAPLDADYGEERFIDDSAADRIGAFDGETSGSFGEDGPDLDALPGTGLSLVEHLQQQAGAALSGSELLVALFLIEQIDECGYLSADLLEVARQLAVPLAMVERALAVIQTFDPAGVGARNLAECIALQAKDADRHDPAMARLIDNLELLAKGQLAQLRRICEVDDEDLADMITELRGYDPKPGLRFGGEPVRAVTPDIFVVRRGKGWAVEINAATLPKLLVNRRYHAELSSSRQDKASRAWLTETLASANWLVRALDQRQRTIIRVASEIVTRQQAFFERGVAHMKPLTLKAVAEAIGMHESTVSRATANKYLSCARGVFELKYFFTSAIQSADGGDAVSAEAVKSQIRALIAAEDAKAILSDDTLVELLNAKGFDIARRTVAKYREAMGIGSSVLRRRQKAMTSRAA